MANTPDNVRRDVKLYSMFTVKNILVLSASPSGFRAGKLVALSANDGSSPARSKLRGLALAIYAHATEKGQTVDMNKLQSLSASVAARPVASARPLRGFARALAAHLLETHNN